MRGVAAVTAALVLVAPAGAAAAKSHRCDRRGSRTAAANAKVRAYSVDGRSDRVLLYGCLRRNGRRTLLDRSYANQYESYGPTDVRLSGPLAAIGHEDYSFSTNLMRYSAFTYDLRSGKRTRFYRSEGGERLIADFEMARSGSIALIESQYQTGGPKPTSWAVRKVEANGATELEAGAEVGRHSLAIRGQRVHWKSGGQPRSAPID
jgi:hypothetical protein